MLPIPTKLVKQGVRDMLRLSDARMSGTSYGACILHLSLIHISTETSTGDRIQRSPEGLSTIATTLLHRRPRLLHHLRPARNLRGHQGAQFVGRAADQFHAHGPVSYTHLDVYKRQPEFHG